MNTFYFRMYLTESEHGCLEAEFDEYLFGLNKDGHVLRMVYYRQMTPHIPMIREIKLEGQQSSIEHFKRWMQNKKYTEFVDRTTYD